MSEFVLDASALLAAAQNEPGADKVEATFGRALLSSVNLAEFVAKMIDNRASETDVADAVRQLRVDIVPFQQETAVAAGLLRAGTRAAGLSLGDRACIALAIERGVPAVTADRSWATLSLPVPVILIR